MRKGPRKVIDKEIIDIVRLINKLTPYKTLGSCCGHGKYPETIIIECPVTKKRYEVFSGIEIPRKKRFYVRDNEGEYYIPEVINQQV